MIQFCFKFGIIDGRKLKSINHKYNKLIGKLQSEIDTTKSPRKKEELNKLKARIFQNRKNKISDYLHKSAKKIVDVAVESGVHEIIIGRNKEWKQNCNMGKKNNQNFVQIPHATLFEYIKYRAEIAGINVVFQEESYTSKCDALAIEEIKKQITYFGKRVHRGLFRSKTGQLINADVNGALNILRKCKGKFGDLWVAKLASMGNVSSPVRYFI